ncbi:hypothetical protein Shyd_25360 [Streptomyces hydrogenans]|uniref:Uncharacterized protein n=1 Tax=Streptomyces hydrogenans TaxID=1873719 RepID=A0ABQ3P833_9ACTN|nr:hypothetical protein GCM10018784_30900 [Streptomyces hydrogenans]GHI21165.1 hypothetical protein Shyd_25360 [Streptomyces hydrogenans]
MADAAGPLKVSGTAAAVVPGAAAVCPAESITRETPAAISPALPLVSGAVIERLLADPWFGGVE